MIRIDRDKIPKKSKKNRIKYDFDSMSKGDSFYYDGARSAALIAFGYRAIRGCFSTEKEGEGWRFFLHHDPTKSPILKELRTEILGELQAEITNELARRLTKKEDE